MPKTRATPEQAENIRILLQGGAIWTEIMKDGTTEVWAELNGEKWRLHEPAETTPGLTRLEREIVSLCIPVFLGWMVLCFIVSRGDWWTIMWLNGVVAAIILYAYFATAWIYREKQ